MVYYSSQEAGEHHVVVGRTHREALGWVRRQRERGGWARALMAVSWQEMGKAGSVGLGSISLNNVSRLRDIGGVPGSLVPAPGVIRASR